MKKPQLRNEGARFMNTSSGMANINKDTQKNQYLEKKHRSINFLFQNHQSNTDTNIDTKIDLNLSLSLSLFLSLSIYICICKYIRIYIYIYTHICTYICIYIHMSINDNTKNCVSRRIRIKAPPQVRRSLSSCFSGTLPFQ